MAVLRGAAHPAALFVANKLGADVEALSSILLVGLMASLVGGPLFQARQPPAV
jgi:hypothetical protein